MKDPIIVHPDVPLLAELVAIAYARSVSTHNDLLVSGGAVFPERWKLNHTAVDNVQLTLGTSSRGRRAIVFPGTNELADWGNNFNIFPRRLLGVPGYWAAGTVRAINRAFEAVVRPFIYDTSGDLLVTGHSFGGGLAGTAAAELTLYPAESDVKAVITWASPRFTTGAGRNYINVRYGGYAQRIVHGFDAVPWLVPAGPLLGFRHAFPVLHVGSDGTLRDTLNGGDLFREFRYAVRTRGVQAVRHHYFSPYLRWARGLRRQ